MPFNSEAYEKDRTVARHYNSNGEVVEQLTASPKDQFKAMAGGRKYDNQKPRWDLMPPEIEQVVDVLTYGASKYDDRNWEQGIKWGRVFAATLRHLWAFWRGEDKDQESGMDHLAHAACNCLFLLHYKKHCQEYDDRPNSIKDKHMEELKEKLIEQENRLMDELKRMAD